MSWRKGLAGSVLSIARTDEKRVRVIAGPGTGKSFALKRRVARLLEQGQDPTRIFAVTFTRNAAQSLVDDLNNLNVAGCKKVRASTLHAYCFGVLNREDIFEQLKRTPRPILTFSTTRPLQFESGMIINDLVWTQKFGKKRDCTKRVLAFEAAWARSQYEQPGWSTDPTDKLLEEHLLSWLRFHHAMLIGELVPETLRFLRNNPASIELTAFDHVLVDEYQDLNRADQEIIDLLAKKVSLTIVGDADQSIYRFRHANPEGISDFQNRHPTTHDESLTECIRCPARVVKIADCLIKNNHLPDSPPRLRAKPTNINGKIHIIQWKSTVAEAKGVSEYVKYLIDQGYNPGEILILSPREILASEIRNRVEEKNIPIYSFFYEKVLKKDSAQRAFTLLTLLNDKEDRVALRWWLGHGSQSGRSEQYQKLRTYCEESGKSPRQVLEAMDQRKLNLPGTLNLLKLFGGLVKETGFLSTLDLRDLIDALLPRNDDNCSVLRAIAERALAESGNIHQLFDYIRTNIIHPEVPNGSFVRIMSPQKAKGLSSRVVIVTSCIEGLFPGIRNDQSFLEQNENIREQRRLFYVAITRCKESLVLSSFMSVNRGEANRMKIPVSPAGGFWVRQIPSKYIDELGPTAPASQSGPEWQVSGYGEKSDP